MKIYYDFEFYEDGKTITPLSIGMVTEDGEELYIVYNPHWWPNDLVADVNNHPFLRENVLPHLMAAPTLNKCRDLIGLAAEIHDFTLRVAERSSDGQSQLWGYYTAYDHVALAQLWGPMMKLPPHLPMFTLDLQQEIVRLNFPAALMPAQVDEHNALADARWNLQLHRVLTEYERPA